MFKWLVGNAGHLPQLIPDQILKLKQLTVLTLASTSEVFFFFLDRCDIRGITY